MAKLLRIFGIPILVGVIAVTGAATLMPELRQSALRRLVLGPPLLEVAAPLPAQIVGQGGVALLVRFPRPEQTLPSSLRCLLNGVDVTEQLALGENGAAGSLWSRHEGPQVLRLEVFGRAWWGARYFEDSVEVVFEVRGHPSLDRA